jgi:diketogulonate reductase-like aldo/keto reductase
MILKEYFTLYNDVKIPKLGFGTWQIKDGEQVINSVKSALQVGYCHIDTALMYQNERGVGKAIRESEMHRKNLFITTKLPAQIKGYHETIAAFYKSLNNLKLEYIDLYLIHASHPWNDPKSDYTEGNIQSWKAMIELYNQGLIKAIGVSNFYEKDILPLIEATGVVPMVNQVPLYIGRSQDKLRRYGEENNILIEAYSPLVTGKIFSLPILEQLANKYKVTPAQIAIRFTLQLNTLPLPKSTHHERIKENSQLDFIIDNDDMEQLLSLDGYWKK